MLRVSIAGLAQRKRGTPGVTYAAHGLPSSSCMTLGGDDSLAIVLVRQRRSPGRLLAMVGGPLVACAVIACCLGATRQLPSQPESTWRRTRDGWEHLVHDSHRRPCEVTIHPLYIVTLQALLAAMALVAYESPRRSTNSAPAPHFVGHGSETKRRWALTSRTVSP